MLTFHPIYSRWSQARLANLGNLERLERNPYGAIPFPLGGAPMPQKLVRHLADLGNLGRAGYLEGGGGKTFGALGVFVAKVALGAKFAPEIGKSVSFAPPAPERFQFRGLE